LPFHIQPRHRFGSQLPQQLRKINQQVPWPSSLAVVAGLVAAVKLTRVESGDLLNRSPRVRSAISDSVTIARMVIELPRRAHDFKEGDHGRLSIVEEAQRKGSDLHLHKHLSIFALKHEHQKFGPTLSRSRYGRLSECRWGSHGMFVQVPV
jgi:hypothetical protein